MKKKYLFFLPVVLFCGCTGTGEKTDLLSSPGMEVQTSAFPGKTFQPYSRVMIRDNAGWLVRNPGKMPVFFVVFQGVSLDAEGIYELNMRYVGLEGTRLIISGSEFNGETYLKGLVLMNTVSSVNVNGAAEYRKEFAVTPDCNRLIPSLSVINPGKNGHGTELLVEELSIRRTGTMKAASSSIRTVNLASDYDFAKYPEGDFEKICKGYGKQAKRWSSIKAEIVNLDGENVLHIVRKPENYIYPYMELKPFPVDPKYYFVKLSFKIKGKGSIKPGLWWKRNSLNWDYYHGGEVKLTDQWQTVTVIHPCMTPDVKNATMSFTSGGSGEFWIKDITANLE